MTTNPRLVALADEFALNRAGLDYLDALVAQEKRDFTPEERTSYDRTVARNDVIATELPEALDREKRYDAAAAATAAIVAPAPAGPETGRSGAFTRSREAITYDPTKAGQPYAVSHPGLVVEELGAFLLGVGRAKLGKITVDEANGELSRFGVSVSEELGRVVAHGVAADGTAPVTIEGDLIKFVDANRYAVNRSRRLPMPDNHAPTFKRPRVSQRTTAGQQVTEGDVLSSQRLQLTGDTVTKGTFGGVLSLSEQEIDWTDPAILGLAIEDLAESYAISTDTVLTTAIETALTASVQTVVSNTAASDVFIAAVAASVSAVYGTAKKVPDVLYAALDRWAYLAALVDGTGRPMFPIQGGQVFNDAGVNPGGVATLSGMNVMGLDVVVDPNFTAGKWGTGVSMLAETYEQNKGLLTIAVPSTLEVQYAYRGYFAANVYTAGVNAFETS